MRKLFYILSVLAISMLPVTAKAESVNYSAPHPAPTQESQMAMPMNENMGMTTPEKDMGCPCCKKMGMQCGMMSGKMMSDKMDGMQCMNKGDGKAKCGCCEKMMGKKSMSTPRSGNSFQFNN